MTRTRQFCTAANHVGHDQRSSVPVMSLHGYSFKFGLETYEALNVDSTCLPKVHGE
jgi:hypothetical protein